MIKYTKDHVWLNIPDKMDVSAIDVGITRKGNDAVGGIQFVDAVDGKLVVESTKTSFEFELPVEGTLHSVRNYVDYSGENEVLGEFLACFAPWRKVNEEELLDKDPDI